MFSSQKKFHNLNKSPVTQKFLFHVFSFSREAFINRKEKGPCGAMYLPRRTSEYPSRAPWNLKYRSED